MDSFHSHPYYPPDAQIYNYSPNTATVLSLLLTASAGTTALLGATYILTIWARPNLSKANRFAVLWFVLSGTLHCFFEGYFIVNHTRMASAQDFFGQLWKEYALSDSRYLTSDTLVLCMETITVLVWGPMCFGVAYSILSNHSLRHPLQIIVCMAHLYGDTLYYSTSLFDDYARGRPYCRPESVYFWIYYFLMNFIWIVIPFCKLSPHDCIIGLLLKCPLVYLYQSMKTVSHALKQFDSDSHSRKSK
ncbi:EXPERA domain-containing protein [Aspergillus lucknowensis]|uniref:Emopamil binding protein-domain-containing protein n=1 Tax=Aspergillus lucknowensis TaxID=176173 RepID=A0ABR4M5P1_9EURO